MVDEVGVTEELARFASALKFEDLPDEIVDHLKYCVLDTVGCGLFGSTLPWSQIQQKWAEDWESKAQSSVFDSPRRMAAPFAALVNGTMIHGFEMDDLHKESIIHLGSVVFPSVWALAETLNQCSGKDFLLAIAAGYEVGARVGASIGSSHLLRGFHPTGTSGTFAAGAGAGKILGLGAEKMLHTLGIAGTQGAGLMAAQFSSMVKRMHAGRAAESGVYAATLADRGFTGITNIVEAEYGGYCRAMADICNMERVTEGLGKTWEINSVGFKPYPCCGSTHTTLDGLLELVQENRLSWTDIDKVDIRTTTVTKEHVGWPYKPEGITAAQMNLYYCVSALLADGRIDVSQFTPERITDPVILKHIPDISIEADASIDARGPKSRHSIAVEIKTRQGQSYGKKVDYSRGSPQKPMGRKDIVDKFRMTAGIIYAPEKVNEIMETILKLDQLADIGVMTALLRGGTPQ